MVDGIHRMPQRANDPYDAPFTVPDRLHRAGIPDCITGGGGAANVRNLAYHAAAAAAYGLPKDEALAAITLYPARIRGDPKSASRGPSLKVCPLPRRVIRAGHGRDPRARLNNPAVLTISTCR